MELQFYGPGYVPQFEGFGCTATQYCAAMTIDSLTEDQNTGVDNGTETPRATTTSSAARSRSTGPTSPRTDRSQAPANPLFTGTDADPNFAAVNPNPSEDLFMNPGDKILIHLHDTPAGLRADLIDLTTRRAGSMTASIANGFGHILFTPNSSTCQEAPYAFHPEYSTADPRGNTWSAHTYNIADVRRDRALRELPGDRRELATAPVPAARTRADSTRTTDRRCVPGTDSSLVKIDGCFFDGRGLGRPVVPIRLAGHQSQPGGRPGASSDAGPVHQPGEPGGGTTRRSRSRPTCPTDRGLRCPVQSALLRSDDGRELRRSAVRRAVLSVLHHRESTMTPARGRREANYDPGHDRPLRRQRRRPSTGPCWRGLRRTPSRDVHRPRC